MRGYNGQFNDEQALSGGSGKILSTNAVKIPKDADMGTGTTIKVRFLFTEALVTAVATKVVLEINADSASGGSFGTRVIASKEFTGDSAGATDIIAGFEQALAIPPGLPGEGFEYLKTSVSVHAASNGDSVSPSSGKITSGIVYE